MPIIPASIFGIALAPLYWAIAEVESHNGYDPRAHGNTYQIDAHGGHAYVDDVNRIIDLKKYGLRHFKYEDVFDRAKSEYMMLVYWHYYGERLRASGVEPTAQLLAKIHNVGYRGLTTKPTAADAYWAKVSKELANYNRYVKSEGGTK